MPFVISNYEALGICNKLWNAAVRAHELGLTKTSCLKTGNGGQVDTVPAQQSRERSDTRTDKFELGIAAEKIYDFAGPSATGISNWRNKAAGRRR